MSGFFVFNLRRSSWWLALLMSICLTLIGVQYVLSAEQEARMLAFLNGRTIVIDAGHGGPDGGAVAADGLLEKDVTLAVTLALRDLLQVAGARVVLTRETDEDISRLPADASLRERWRAAHKQRVSIANQSGADVVLSIHANAVPSPRWFGAQTFYRADEHQASQALAEHVQRELKHITGGTEREASQHVDHYLLKHAEMPAIIVEVGFLSNPREAELLAHQDYQAKLAWAVFVGLAHYLYDSEPTFAPSSTLGL